MIASYFGKKWLPALSVEKAWLAAYTERNILEKWLAIHSKDWLHILKQTWFDNTFCKKKHDCNAFWKKKWLQLILENTWLNKHFGKKNMIAMHSGKTWL